MPNYDYECLVCGRVKEVRHTISEVTEPTEETVKLITCYDCDARMVRVFTSPPNVPKA